MHIKEIVMRAKLIFTSIALLCSSYQLLAERFVNETPTKVTLYILTLKNEQRIDKFVLSTGAKKEIDLSKYHQDGMMIVVKQAPMLSCCQEHEDELVTLKGHCDTCADSACKQTRGGASCKGINLQVNAKEMHRYNAFHVVNGERGRFKIKVLRVK